MYEKTLCTVKLAVVQRVGVRSRGSVTRLVEGDSSDESSERGSRGVDLVHVAVDRFLVPCQHAFCVECPEPAHQIVTRKGLGVARPLPSDETEGDEEQEQRSHGP